MLITLHNLDAEGVLHVNGPSVSVQMSDMGQAQVVITLAISDGTVFSFTGGEASPPSTVLPPGKYICALVISAFNHGAFGDTYRSDVTVGGKLVATTSGKIPAGSDNESAPIAFFLQV